MIHLSGVALARGARSLLADASLRIHAGERVGVVGRNGCGKSTLFALLRSQIQPDAGHCEVPADWRIAAMEQEVAASARRAIDFVLDGDAELRALETAIATAGDAELGELHARFAAIDGYRAAARAHELLDGLGCCRKLPEILSLLSHKHDRQRKPLARHIHLSRCLGHMVPRLD